MMRLFRRPTLLRVQIRSVDSDALLPVELAPGETYAVKNDGRTTLKIVFTGDGVEVIQAAPHVVADPDLLRRWADFAEENQ